MGIQLMGCGEGHLPYDREAFKQIQILCYTVVNTCPVLRRSHHIGKGHGSLSCQAPLPSLGLSRNVRWTLRSSLIQHLFIPVHNWAESMLEKLCLLFLSHMSPYMLIVKWKRCWWQCWKAQCNVLRNVSIALKKAFAVSNYLSCSAHLILSCHAPPHLPPDVPSCV